MQVDIFGSIVSRTARHFIKRGIDTGLYKEELAYMGFDPDMREEFTNSNGLDYYTVLGSLDERYSMSSLILRYIELNVSEEEANTLLQNLLGFRDSRWWDLFDTPPVKMIQPREQTS